MTCRALLAALFLLVGTGCAHTVELRSEPPGAQVFLDGEPVGETPVVVTETTGELDVTTVEMRHQGVAARFGLPKDRWALEPFLVGALAGGAGMVGGLALAVGGYALFMTTLLSGGMADPAIGIGLALGGFGLYLSGAVALSLGGWAPFIAGGSFARKSPDVVEVDFTTGEIHVEPGGQIEPLYGVPPGHVPLAPPDDEEPIR